MNIGLEGINKSYGQHIVLQDFNLDINDGEMVAISGGSGKGKTTLVTIIGGLETPDSGDIIIDGKKNPFRKEKDRIRFFRYECSYLFQNYALVNNLTVQDNLDIALQYVEKSKKKKLIEDSLMRLGINQLLKEKVYKLSGGEQQRVALARVMMKPSKLILADEPTGALDPINRDEVINILKEEHKKGKTIIIVTHDPVVAEACDRIVEL